MKIGVITAMSTEHAQVAQLLDNKRETVQGNITYTIGDMGENSVILMQSGIGKVNAAVGAVELIRTFDPQCVISTGVAGGLEASIKVMDVVASSQVAYHDVWCGDGNAHGQVQGLPTYFEGNAALLACIASIESDTMIHQGLICTGDQFISEPEQLAQIKQHFPQGLACDMESAAIAQVCHLYQVPFISFRIISDAPGTEEGHWAQYTNFWQSMADCSFGVTKKFLQALPTNL